MPQLSKVMIEQMLRLGIVGSAQWLLAFTEKYKDTLAGSYCSPFSAQSSASRVKEDVPPVDKVVLH